MFTLPMHAPAEIHRRVDVAESERAAEVVVAKGPLVIMAYGLLALDEADRRSCWLSSPAGPLSAEQAQAILRRWSTAH